MEPVFLTAAWRQLGRGPSSVFVAEGSPIVVRTGVRVGREV